MSHRIGNITIICPEPKNICELCGAFEETRPYGANGEYICFECGQKDIATTEKMMAKVLFGES